MLPSQDPRDLATESDVEQKVVMPLLTATPPAGLGFPAGSIKTKLDIRRLPIGKGREGKLYYPDYLVVLFGLPMLVVEAKAPNEDLSEAYREARLYAMELNAKFPAGVNPAARIVCVNGRELISGPWDSNIPTFRVKLQDLHAASASFAEFADYVNLNALQGQATRALNEITKRPFYKPVRLLGGQSVRNEEIGYNGFGASLALDYGHLFNPTTREERAFIVKNAYIPSRRRERYIDPIDRVIRAAVPPSESDAILVENTDDPKEMIQTLGRGRALERRVLLLIGGVGAGKSTFIDYLREVALPQQLVRSTTWAHVNMNESPLTPDLIYGWLCDQISGELRTLHPEYDFDALNVIERVYSVELDRLRKGALKLLDPGSAAYRERLADEILRLQREPASTLNALCRYLCGQRGKTLIVVLDNCDKRVRDEQLLMFQAAQWLQQQVRCVVLLPLRDETYDNHRNEPPLDTALKDLVFRIEPPLFSAVLSKRIDLALKEMHGPKELSYNLPNGMRVQYPATEQAYYLLSILRSVFEYDRFVRSMIVGLAGRDLRRAMEIFLELCTSGHIGEDQILKIRQARGQYTLPYDVVARVMLRLSRRFYDDGQSYLKNLFHCELQDPKPNYFTRLCILRWLKERWRDKGPTGVTGYHQVRLLKGDLIPLGIGDTMLRRELLTLLRAQCIVAEHLRTDHLAEDDLVRLNSPGFVHLDMVDNAEYLAAVSEDLWYDDEKLAADIADRIGGSEHFTPETTFDTAEKRLDYLRDKLRDPFPSPEAYLEPRGWDALVSLDNAAAQVRKERARRSRNDPWFEVGQRYHLGQQVSGLARWHPKHGLFVEIQPHLTGLVPASTLRSIEQARLRSMSGSTVVVNIKSIDPTRKRLGLSLVEP